MAGREPPYDPYIPSGSGGAGEHLGQNGENPRTAALQAQIDDTVHIMKQNLHKASERGSQIDNLNETTRNLDKNSALFKRGARDLRLEMAWKNNKMRCWIALAILVIILVVVVPIAVHFKH